MRHVAFGLVFAAGLCLAPLPAAKAQMLVPRMGGMGGFGPSPFYVNSGTTYYNSNYGYAPMVGGYGVVRPGYVAPRVGYGYGYGYRAPGFYGYRGYARPGYMGRRGFGFGRFR